MSIALTWLEPDIGLLTIDTPGKRVNVLTRAVLEELSRLLDEVESRRDVAGVVVASGKPGTFVAGADLRELIPLWGAPAERVQEICRRGHALLARLASGSFVSVAAIDGVCVGGGAELALWCDHRVLSRGAATSFGLPEVKLGLLPGWGGTALTPRLIGIANAVELITRGEPVQAAQAQALGLCTDVPGQDDLLPAAVRLIREHCRTREFLDARQRRAGPPQSSPTELAFLRATAAAMIQAETKGHNPAPPAGLELLIEGASLDAETALGREAEVFSTLFGTPVNRALVNVFFLTDRNKKDSGIDPPAPSSTGQATPTAPEPREVATVGVVGAGIMGAGIAAANLKHHVPVVLSDAAPTALRAGAHLVLEEAAYDRHTKRPDPQRALALGALLNLGDDRLLAGCDLVVEAIVENAEVKRQLYARLEPQLGEQAILASNTSTIPITQLARGLQRPAQFCGLHFFNPVRRMRLVEIIRGEETSDATVATAVAYAKRLGKFPIVVRDGPGFLVNRLLFPYMNEALQLLIEGVPMRDLDRVATRFGMPMGPIELYDMVGLDTALLAGRTMWEAYPDRIAALPILPALVKQGRLGPKSGRGFYNYQNKRGRPESDPDVERLLEAYIRTRRTCTDEELTHRLFLPMLLEATRVLEERLVRDVRDVDLGLIFGLGFPAWRGGLLCWADSLGAAKIVELLQPLSALGARFRPTELLSEMARDGRTFYPAS